MQAERQSRKLIPSRIPAGMTSYCQWLDAFRMFLFKTNCRKVGAQTVHGMQIKLTVGEKCVIVSIIVGEAHELTTRALEPTIFAKFVSFGYVRTIA